MNRQTFLSIAASAAFAAQSPSSVWASAKFSARLHAIERRTGGRLGVYARDLGDGRVITHNAFERFPMCSTFKILLVGAVLQRVDRKREHFARTIAYTAADFEAYAPITRANVARGAMSVHDLCAAVMTVSDNTAANLLLRSIGGPAAVTAFVRSNPFEDSQTRLDRTEPTLNTAIDGDPRDTTWPSRMANDLGLLLTSDAVLTRTSSHRLETWMRACTTGTDTLRAGVPASWLVGDKTGSGENATRNDVAIFRPPHRAPIIVAAYLTGAHAVDRSIATQHLPMSRTWSFRPSRRSLERCHTREPNSIRPTDDISSSADACGG